MGGGEEKTELPQEQAGGNFNPLLPFYFNTILVYKLCVFKNNL